ncbi:hypothetical protein ABZ281_29895, partial [Streptomyces sp. NPDC006265]
MPGRGWRILTKLRTGPTRATGLLRALLVLTNLEVVRSAAAGNVRPATTPGTLPHALDSARAGGTPTRRTGRNPKYVQ